MKYFLILLIMFSCQKPPIEGCKDKKAINYNRHSKNNCCCIYNPKLTVYTDSATLDSFKKYNYGLNIYVVKNGANSGLKRIDDLLNPNNFVFKSLVDKNNVGKLEVQIWTTKGKLLYYRKFTSMGGHDDILDKITF